MKREDTVLGLGLGLLAVFMIAFLRGSLPLWVYEFVSLKWLTN